MYLYIMKKDDFSDVPETLITLFGDSRLVIEFDINQKDKLGREDIVTVKENLHQQGFHLQMPENIPGIIPDKHKH